MNLDLFMTAGCACALYTTNVFASVSACEWVSMLCACVRIYVRIISGTQVFASQNFLLRYATGNKFNVQPCLSIQTCSSSEANLLKEASAVPLTGSKRFNIRHESYCSDRIQSLAFRSWQFCELTCNLFGVADIESKKL